MRFTRGTMLNDVTASGINQPTDTTVFAGKVAISGAYVDPLRRAKPVKKQRSAKTALLGRRPRQKRLFRPVSLAP